MSEAAPRLLSIQYLRGAAAVSVAAYHALQWREGGFDIGRAGVDVFFVISGVIMWLVTAGRPVSPARFLWRRFSRVAPVYWLATLLVFTVALAWRGFLPQVLPGVAHLLMSLAFVPHLDPRGLPFPTLPPGWTLDYEAAFYGVFAVGLLFAEGARVWFVTGALLAIVAAGLVLADPAYILGANPMLLQFAAGVWIGRATAARGLPGPGWGAVLFAAGLAGFALVSASGLFAEIWRPFLWGAPAALLVAGALTLEARGRVPRLPALTALGDASYSLYVFHLPAIAVVAHLTRRAPTPVFFALSLAAAIAVGLAARRWLELPLTAWARSLVSRRAG